jgi:hypothetical protein
LESDVCGCGFAAECWSVPCIPHLSIEDAVKTYLPFGHLLVAESREASGVTLVKPFCQPSEFLAVMREKHRYNVERAFSFKAGKASFFDNWLEERRLANMPPRACVVKRRARRHVHKSPPQMQKALLSGTM